ncbi:hypothetical protein B296_00004758 [Ensete ventricosum]|uniref:Uncharacterized protein n=1 Tax=Ensete ventricosum TaxID=4639 RepID=A0A427BC94_ENSVE|nr:hypothetical protein B296_00004758 [Ensete ventricosum]
MPPPPPTDLPTWEILPIADGHFQWAAAAGDPGVQPVPPLRTLVRGVHGHPDHRLPSMADLLTLGISLSILLFSAWHLGSETFQVSDVSDGNGESCFGEREFDPEGEVCSRRRGRCGHKWINKTWWDMNQETAGTSLLDCVDVNSVHRSPENCINKFCSTGSHLTNGQLQKALEHRLDSSDYGQSPVKFQTAGGRYISISNDALKRARSLLGESDIEASENNITLDQPLSSVLRNKKVVDVTFSNKDNISSPHSPHCGGMNKLVSRTPPSLTKRRQFSVTRKIKSDSYTLDQENARSFTLKNIYSGNKTLVNQKPEKDDLHSAGSAVEIVRRIENGDGTSLGGPLIDISNIAGDYMTMNRLPNEKRRPGKTSYVSPFKRPRSSRSLEDYTDSALKLLMEIRQSHLQKKIEKALKDAGLVSREVTPFMRVRVAGLTSKHSCRKGRFREGLITIWSPTEDQVMVGIMLLLLPNLYSSVHEIKYASESMKIWLLLGKKR